MVRIGNPPYTQNVGFEHVVDNNVIICHDHSMLFVKMKWKCMKDTATSGG
jgi:hypothetical protein